MFVLEMVRTVWAYRTLGRFFSLEVQHHVYNANRRTQVRWKRIKLPLKPY